MTMSTAPMANGATVTLPSTVATTVKTRKKVPMNSVRYLRILAPSGETGRTGPAAVSGLNGQTVSGDHCAEVVTRRDTGGVSRPAGSSGRFIRPVQMTRSTGLLSAVDGS